MALDSLSRACSVIAFRKNTTQPVQSPSRETARIAVDRIADRSSSASSSIIDVVPKNVAGQQEDLPAEVRFSPPGIRGFTFVEDRTDDPATVQVTSVHKFKGLERKVVISYLHYLYPQ